MANDDVGNWLTSLGIEKRRIIPTNIEQRILRQRPELNQFSNEINIFPLEWFDDGGTGNDSRLSADCCEGKRSDQGRCCSDAQFTHPYNMTTRGTEPLLPSLFTQRTCTAASVISPVS